eukprot:c17804_g1_i1 orf=213-1043(+)
MDDEWGLSVEELASIEENAKRRVAERRGSSSLASSAASPLNSPSKGRSLPSSFYSSPSKGGSQRPLSVKIFRDRPGRIGLEMQYHPALVAALKTVPGHEWDQVRRVWTYAEDKLELLMSAIHSLSTVPTKVDIIPPLYLPKAQQGCFQGPLSFQNIFSEPQQGWTHTSGGVSPNSTCSKRPFTVTVQLYLMDSDIVAAKNPYHESIKEACQSVSGRAWNTEERVWTFPKSSFEELVQALRRVRNPLLVIEAIHPLKLPESSSLSDNESLRCSPMKR